MKSQEIKIRNLPVSEIKPKSVRVKPVEILLALVALGVYFIFQRNLLTSTGMVLVLLGISCIILMPDRTLVQFLPDYMIMYNSRDREICNMIYWDEVVCWMAAHSRWICIQSAAWPSICGSLPRTRKRRTSGTKRDKMMVKLVNKEMVEECRRQMVKERDYDDMSLIFTMFADSTRLKIMNALFVSELCVGDLAALLEMSSSAVSHQLSSLKKARLVRTRREGKLVFYSMADDHIKNIYKMAFEHIHE